MSDYELPDLPSDEELGIDGDDLGEFLDEDGNLQEDKLEAKLKKEFEEAQQKAAEGPPSRAAKREARRAAKQAKKAAAQKGAPAGGTKPKAEKASSPGWFARRAASRAERKAAAGAVSSAAAAAPAQGSEKGSAKGGAKGAPAEGVPVYSAPSWRGPVTFLILVGVAWAGSPSLMVPRASSASAPETEFSSARAMVRLTEIAREAHPTGSPEHTRVRGLIVSRLQELGLEPMVDSTTSLRRFGESLQAATVRNVIARIPGQSPTGTVLVTAHYDSRSLSRGAGDDGVGVVTILESLRALVADGERANDLIVLITDAEELGLLGARAFVRQHPWFADVTVAISIEMRGGGGPSIMFETGAENGWMIEQFKAAAPRPWANSFTEEVYKRLPRDTDFTPFKLEGVQGVNFAGIGRAPIYHQAFDAPENVDEKTIQHHGTQVLALLRHLGDQDLSDVQRPSSVYFRLPLVGLIVYPPSWVLLISGGLLLGGLLTLGVIRRAEGNLKGVVVGLGLGAASLAGAFGLGWGLWRWVGPRHPELGALEGSSLYAEGAYVLGLVAGVFALTTLLFGLARRKHPLASLAFGGALLPLLTALGLSVAAPLSAMNLQWPALASLAAALVAVGVAPKLTAGPARWFFLMLLAIPVLVMLEPLLELVWVAMSLSLAPGLAVMAGLTALLLLPPLDALREPNGWWSPLAFAGIATASILFGASQAGSSAERPEPSRLLFAFDRATQEAVWATSGEAGSEWAESRVGAFEGEKTFNSFFGGPDEGSRLRVTPAATPSIAPLEIAYLSDDADLGVRTLTMALRSSVGAERLDVRVGNGMTIRAVNGQPVPAGAPDSSVGLSRLSHWGVPANGWMVLELQQALPAQPVEVDVTEIHHRPGELIGGDFFRRPPELTPDITTLTDVALVLTTVRVPGPGEVEITPLGFAVSVGSGNDDPEGGPDPSLGVLPDSAGGQMEVPDSGSVVPDTLSAVVDTLTVASDSLPARIDTLARPADTMATPMDTLGLPSGGSPD